MELEIVKVEEGLCDGRVLFHAHVQKSDADRAALQARQDTFARTQTP
jgi:ribosome biogenesis protein SSF1/2